MSVSDTYQIPITSCLIHVRYFNELSDVLKRRERVLGVYILEFFLICFGMESLLSDLDAKACHKVISLCFERYLYQEFKDEMKKIEKTLKINIGLINFLLINQSLTILSHKLGSSLLCVI